jgi:quercetin dioxygenase-like cupin family protein
MQKLSTTGSFPRVVRENDDGALDVLGANVQFLVGPRPGDETPCILKGTVPSGVTIPLHSHDMAEIFFVLYGNIEVLMEEAGKLHWVEVNAGNLIEIPGNSKHAVRNRSEHPAITCSLPPPSTVVIFRKSADRLPLEKAFDHRLRMKFSVF